MTRTLVGIFPAGQEIIAFENVEGALIAAAGRKLDAEREERERIARQTIVVDAEFFHQVVHALDRALAVELRWWTRRRDFDRRAVVVRKIRRLRAGWAEVLDSNARLQR
jgi:hypothetical protein